MSGLIVLALIVVLVIIVVAKSVTLVPQGEAAIVERLGRYTRTAQNGLTFLVPFVDRIRERVDTRERMVTFPPQAVITQDNLTVDIDTVVTFQVNDPARAIYGVADYIFGIEQITTATLRDVVGGLTLEQTLTSREYINRRLRGELDEATAKWGLRIARVELKAIDPPPSIQQAMERQMKADREKRAMILTAEGTREAEIKTAEGRKQSQILAAEGDKHAAVLSAEGERQAMMLRAEGERAAAYLRAQGEARAIRKINAAVKASELTPEVLAWRYLETLPELANRDGNSVWMVPAQFGDSLESFARAFGKPDADGVFRYEAPAPSDATLRQAEEGEDEDWFDTSTSPEIARAVAAASEVANRSVDDPVTASRQNVPEGVPADRAEADQAAARAAKVNPGGDDGGDTAQGGTRAIGQGGVPQAGPAAGTQEQSAWLPSADGDRS